MTKKIAFLFSAMIILAITLACSIAYEGINFTDDPEDLDKDRMRMEMTEMAEQAEMESASSSVPAQKVQDTPEAAATALPAQVPQNAEPRSYSVQAANYDCICAVDGDVSVTFNFNGDTLEVLDGQGVPTVYDKVGENTYSRSFMGYYILDGEEVDEEKRVVITFTDTGYTMEHFSGDSGSPCCVHTFTNK